METKQAKPPQAQHERQREKKGNVDTQLPELTNRLSTVVKEFSESTSAHGPPKV